MRKKRNNKKEVVIFICFIVVVIPIYLIRPLTIHVYGKEYPGVVTKVNTKSGGAPGGTSKFVKYIRNDRVYTQKTGDYHVHVGDYFLVYHKKYFFGDFDYVGDRVFRKEDKVLIFSETVPEDVNTVSIYLSNDFFKKINVTHTKNFGAWVDKSLDWVVVKYNSKVKKTVYPKYINVNFKEIK